jgi:hypothetical protein
MKLTANSISIPLGVNIMYYPVLQELRCEAHPKAAELRQTVESASESLPA